MSALGDIARRGMGLSWLTGQERSVLNHMADCTTERLGGNVLSCTCGHREVHYNSCRDRHCPLCQGAARARWVRAPWRTRTHRVLPCGLHGSPRTEFTLPFPTATRSIGRSFARSTKPLGCLCQSGKSRSPCGRHVHSPFTRTSIALYPQEVFLPDFSCWIAGTLSYLLSVKRMFSGVSRQVLEPLGEVHRQKRTVRLRIGAPRCSEHRRPQGLQSSMPSHPSVVLPR